MYVCSVHNTHYMYIDIKSGNSNVLVTATLWFDSTPVRFELSRPAPRSSAGLERIARR